MDRQLKIWHLSEVHMEPKDREVLKRLERERGDGDGGILLAQGTLFGWLIATGYNQDLPHLSGIGDDGALRRAGFSSWFIGLLLEAIERRYDFILLDCEGPKHPQLVDFSDLWDAEGANDG